MKVTVAIILAGGLGTRLKKVNPILPKPLALINDRPFLEYLMDYWIGQGISRFILSIGYQSQSIIDHFGKKYRYIRKNVTDAECQNQPYYRC